MARTRELPQLGTLTYGVEVLAPNYLRAFHTSLSDRYELYKLFTSRPALNAVTDPPAADTYNTVAMTALMIADRDFEVLGTNMTTALATFNVEGGITLTTAGADNDQGILLPHLNTNQSAWTGITWGSDQETHYKARIKTGPNITNNITWVGLKLTNTPTTATDNDQVFFRYQDSVNSGKWQCIDSNNNVDNAQDSGVTVALSTDYHLAIFIDAARVPHYYINGVLVANGAALKDATDYIPYIGVAASGAAAAKAVSVRAASISRLFA